MVSALLLTVVGGVAIYILTVYRKFSTHLAQAQASGIPYFVVPFFLANRTFQLCCVFLLPIFRALPSSWTESWLDFVLEWGWKLRYEPFSRLGADTFLTVSPERIVLNTADANVIAQITNRRNDFPKALEVYESLKIYGDNVVTSEGQRWRHHRKIVSPPFSEKNNALVWQETINQTTTMVESWFDSPEQKETRTLKTIADDAMRLSLHIISRAGFGVPLEWPKKGAEGEEHVEELENGHTMTYIDALGTLLHNILLLLAVPKALLKFLPFEIVKKTQRSYLEWGQYMSEMYAQKKTSVLSEKSSDQLDLMVAMIKNANVTSDPKTQTLSDSEILGNAFVFILAGHETTANSIHFSLIYLALNPPAQRALQASLDAHLDSRLSQTWSYETDLPVLASSLTGAVMNEQLRLLSPVVAVPKCTPPHSPQSLTIGGQKCTVPPNTYISLMTPAAHRNPHQWPAGPPRDPDHPSHPLSNRDNDLEEFKPERWILDTEEKRSAAAKITRAFASAGGAFDFAGNEKNEIVSPADPSSDSNGAAPPLGGMYRPPKGAYIPFSEGHRSCLGKRFAQVELLAALAVIFKNYSVELSLDDDHDDSHDSAEGNLGSEEKKKALWEAKREEVERQLRDDMSSVITLQLRKGFVGLKLVRRGAERYKY